MSKTLKIEVTEVVTIKEDLKETKPWFDGPKKFHTVKVLPKERK